MGMTDKQFNVHLRSLISRLEAALKAEDWKLVQELKDELQKGLED